MIYSTRDKPLHLSFATIFPTPPPNIKQPSKNPNTLSKHLQHISNLHYEAHLTLIIHFQCYLHPLPQDSSPISQRDQPNPSEPRSDLLPPNMQGIVIRTVRSCLAAWREHIGRRLGVKNPKRRRQTFTRILPSTATHHQHKPQHNTPTKRASEPSSNSNQHSISYLFAVIKTHKTPRFMFPTPKNISIKKPSSSYS